jgi:YidC/Oxa1 family membrane protein insertase
MLHLFNIILYQPLLNLLVILYQYLPGHDFGVAVIILTIIIKILLYPLGTWGIKSQKALSELQPKIKEVQERYKNNKEKQAKEMLEIYKKAKINPFSGILPLLIQLPILIALYRVFWQGLKTGQEDLLYSFVSISEPIKPLFFGIINLSQPSLILAVLSGVFQFWQTKMVSPKIKQAKNLARKQDKGSDFASIIQKEMQYFFPVFTVLILAKLPSALGLYIVTTSIFSIIQQYFTLKNQNSKIHA